MSAVDDRRRLVGDELSAAMLAHPGCEIAIVDVHDSPAGNRDLGRHPADDERGALTQGACVAPRQRSPDERQTRFKTTSGLKESGEQR
jgi:hypothetical protein